MLRPAGSSTSLAVVWLAGAALVGCTNERDNIDQIPGGTSGTVAVASGNGGGGGEGGAAGRGGSSPATSNAASSGGAGSGTGGDGSGGTPAGPAGTSGSGAGEPGELPDCGCMIDRYQSQGCGDCFAKAVGGNCSDEYGACVDSPACVAVASCMAQDQCGDFACLEGCRAAGTPAGLDLIDALYACTCADCARGCFNADVCD